MIGPLRAALLGLACLIGVATGATRTCAGAYPDHRIRWLIATSPGGPIERATRILAQYLSDRLGQTVTVENGAGAAAETIAAPPDGYTLLLSSAADAFRAARDNSSSVDTVRETVPVAGFMQVTLVLVMSSALPVKNLRELLNFCRANPRRIAFASPSDDSAAQMSAELFRTMSGCDMVRIRYAGSALAYPDLVTNKIQLVFDNSTTAMEQAGRGHMRALAVTSAWRWPGLPDVPAIAETVMGYESAGLYGISVRNGTPPDIIDRLNRVVTEALNDPKLVARLAEFGGMPKPMPAAEFGKRVADEAGKWRDLADIASAAAE
jgi:tripartite-type tricarboxylate transporter receptor subunit TctC